MTDLPRSDPPRYRTRIGSAISKIIRARITAGILTVLPIWLTYEVVVFVFNLMRRATEPFAEFVVDSWLQRATDPVTRARVETFAHWLVPVLAVLLTLILLYLLGLFTANVLGRRILGTLERAFDRLPIVKTIYRSTKQLLETFKGGAGQSQRVVLIEYPHAGMRSIAFVTATMTEQHSGERLCTVFMPCTPNPTTGFLLVLPSSRVYETDWTVEQAIRLIISGGVLAPPAISFSGLAAGSPAAAEPKA
ncbi:MAG TPA: DUF502 domain-containing protein [Phycisphaerae bacterium]